jgi:serine protease Do
MTGSVTPNNQPHGIFSSVRRMVLLATVIAGFGAAALAPNIAFKSDFPSALAQNLTQQAQNLPAPTGFADIVERVKPAVVSVKVKANAARTDLDNSQMERFFRRFGRPDDEMPDIPRGPRNRPVTGQGSGFFISADGYVVTNHHVVANADVVEVTTDDGKIYTAKVIGVDQRTDLALIKIDGRTDFPFVTFADKPPRVGDWVLAVGNPFGLGGTVTAGIVSARGRDIGAGPYDDFLQIDAPVNRGNSGGPTFNVLGQVIGVNTAIFSPSGGNIGIAFAIPADTVKSVILQLREKGVVTRGWIGVQIQPVTAEIAENMGLKVAQGALVSEPQPGSPAAKAGIESGDIITAVNGNPVKDARDLAKQIGLMAPNSSVKLTVIRKGAERTITLTLGQMPSDQPQARRQPDIQRERDQGPVSIPRLGLRLAPATDDEGAVVRNVEPDGIAAEHGLQVGDIILEAAGKRVRNPRDVVTAVTAAQNDGKRTVLLRVKSRQGTRFVAIRIGRG